MTTTDGEARTKKSTTTDDEAWAIVAAITEMVARADSVATTMVAT